MCVNREILYAHPANIYPIFCISSSNFVKSGMEDLNIILLASACFISINEVKTKIFLEEH